MTSGWRSIGFVALLAAGFASCSEKGGAEKFVGTWSYSGAINPNCQDYAPIDLTGDTVTITAPDSTHLVVDLGGFCTVNFNVDGYTASAAANQNCTFDIPGFGPASIVITKWTLTFSGGDVLTSDFVGGVLICAPTGTGTLTRIGDGGTTGGNDAGTDDAGTD
jgi:hypothetical protein